MHGVRDSQYAFNQLSETANDNALVKWEAEAAAAQDDRLDDPSAMDIYEVQPMKDWPSTDKEATRVASVEPSASGITLEEVQVALLIDVRKLRKRPTDAQKLAIAWHHNKLQGQIDEFIRVAVTFLGDQLGGYDQLDLMTVMLDAAELDSARSYDDDRDWPDDKD
ncbi:hypothetical protein BDR07DRAFT_1382468 [Suillus spraguei]|nr:hypothetical protein BDR07DRAFT_1382468 [Suillus spraguei]